ncbi:ATP-binding protein [Bacillus paranthracis]|uniref:ATP-binding protein n=1 Tax=Bacillus paranthracis TaxID=2026186 RepID=UPI0021D0A6B2|nr:ATP-binding protein [Bacillus paranthracis]MCU5470852.1 ATP-binding protein [Bacillus paranthracis]
MRGMAYVISLQGPMASGKTTLAKRLERCGFSVIYENPYPIVEKRKRLKLDMNSKEGFIANQKMFIEAKIKDFQNAKGSVVIFDRGPEDIEFYTLFYPMVIGKEWDIEIELKDELYKLRECRSDAIIYLDVSESNLYDRKNNDRTRNRSTFEEKFKLVETEKDWYKQFPVTYVDTNRLAVDALESYFAKWLKGEGYEKNTIIRISNICGV